MCVCVCVCVCVCEREREREGEREREREREQKYMGAITCEQVVALDSTVDPVGQLVQSEADPAELLYLPVPQLEHVPPSLPVDPALHLQSLLEVLPAGELERAGPAGAAHRPADTSPPWRSCHTDVSTVATFDTPRILEC